MFNRKQPRNYRNPQPKPEEDGSLGLSDVIFIGGVLLLMGVALTHSPLFNLYCR